VKRSSHLQAWPLWILLGLSPAAAARADVVSAVQLLREGGCGGILPAARPLRQSGLLNRAAELWAAGYAPAEAAKRSGYDAQNTTGVRINGPDASSVELLKRASCRSLTNPELNDIGVYHRGLDTWLVLASAHAAPTESLARTLATRALQLVNDVRARGTRCGERSFGPAPPVRLSGTLAGVAFGHAADMARHDYFEHEDLAGRSPADRVKAAGYQEKLVGENIAYGPTSAEEVVQGWLDSPGHCENIMNPEFAEMGIANAAGQSSKRGLYWVQLLVAPRA
jgi:uncharacterized protein YkwD